MPESPADERDLRFDVEDGVAIVTINRPATLNAFTRPMIDRMRSLADEAQRDPAVFGLVITGTGKAFCSGLDVSLLSKAAESGVQRHAHRRGNSRACSCTCSRYPSR